MEVMLHFLVLPDHFPSIMPIRIIDPEYQFIQFVLVEDRF